MKETAMTSLKFGHLNFRSERLRKNMKIDLAQDGDHWVALVNTVMNLTIP
jgi:hypothetical protein